MFSFRKPSSLPVAGFRLAKKRSAVLPLMEGKSPPARMCPSTPSSVSTWLLALCPNVLTTLPVVVLISAMFWTLVPLTELKLPPVEGSDQRPPLQVLALTTPLTLGAHEVTV